MDAATTTAAAARRLLLPLRAAPPPRCGAAAFSRRLSGPRRRRLRACASLDRAAVLLDAAAAAAAAGGTGYSQASYYTSLGLFVLSVPGLWSLIKRSVKSKVRNQSVPHPIPPLWHPSLLLESTHARVHECAETRARARATVACQCYGNSV